MHAHAPPPPSWPEWLGYGEAMADVALTVPTTRLLYIGDTYRLTGRAHVLQCELDADGRVDVVLDQTIFYPHGGVSMSIKFAESLPCGGPTTEPLW